jgi:hypothetical protein
VPDAQREAEGQPPVVRIQEFGTGTPIQPELHFRSSSLRMITAARLAGGLLLIFALTVLPPIFAGFWINLQAQYLDYVKWAVAVEIAALGAALGFFFSEERK